TWSSLGLPTGEYSAAEGWRELSQERLDSVIASGERVEQDALKGLLEKNSDYTHIYAGDAGEGHYRIAVGESFRANWMYRKREDLLARYTNFPVHIQRLLERKLVNSFSRAAEVRITDPEGTDIGWNVTPEEARLWTQGSCIPWHIIDATIGSNPKTFRTIESLWSTAIPWIGGGNERYRAGVIHFGFGAEHDDPEFVKFGRENKAPVKHMAHLHAYFPTYEIKDRETGEWFKVIDRGRLTVLEDPAVRRLAALIADPDQLLAYDWVPAIPGINHPGDYGRDYAPDPAAWIRRDVAGEFGRPVA